MKLPTSPSSQNELPNILDRISDCIMVLDREMNCLYVNKQAGKLLGREPEDIIGKNYWDEFPEARSTTFATSCVNALQTQTPIVFEEYYRQWNRWFENHIYPSKEGVTILFTNITERKRTEDDLIESEKRYRTLFENMNAGFVLFEVICDEQNTPIDLLIVAANKGFEDTTGLKINEVIGKRLTHALPGIEKDPADWIGTYGKIALNGEPRNFVEGSQLLGRYYSITAYQPVPKQCAVTFVDITEWKRAEEVLRIREQQLSLIYNTVGDVIFQLKVEGEENYRFVSVNAAFCKVTGLPETAVIGKNVEEVIPEPSLTMVKEKYKQAIRNKAVVRWEETSRYPTGVLTGIVSVAPAFDEQGKCIYLIGSVHDITERKLAEEEILRSREQLRALAVHLQTLIEEERARIAREIHDEIGQILTAIKMDLSLLLRTLEGVKEKKVKAEVTEEIQTLIGLVNCGVQSIRQIVRDLQPEALETMGLLAGIEWLVKEFEKRTKISAYLSLPSNEPKLEKPQTVAVFRLVQEALTNVAKHAEATKVNIKMTTNGIELRLEIEDNGKGISDNDVNRPGSYGLIAMRERIHSIGGEITINGSPGKGTKVEVVLRKTMDNG